MLDILVGLFFGFGHFLTTRERERNEREMRERRGDEESIWTFFRSGLFKREEEYVGHFFWSGSLKEVEADTRRDIFLVRTFFGEREREGGMKNLK